MVRNPTIQNNHLKESLRLGSFGLLLSTHGSEKLHSTQLVLNFAYILQLLSIYHSHLVRKKFET